MLYAPFSNEKSENGPIVHWFRAEKPQNKTKEILKINHTSYIFFPDEMRSPNLNMSFVH